MKHKTNKKDEVLTVGKFESIFDSKFNDLKDFVKSSAKATETVLKKEIQDVKYELKGDICKLEKRLEDTETRLSDKIDMIGTRIDEHEAKPAAIAHSSH